MQRSAPRCLHVHIILVIPKSVPTSVIARENSFGRSRLFLISSILHMALLWTDDSEFTATTQTFFRGSHGASSLRWRTELLDHYTCLNSIRPTALREARSVSYVFLLTICLCGNPDIDDRPTGSHPPFRLHFLSNTAGKASLTVTHTGHNSSNGRALPRCDTRDL